MRSLLIVIFLAIPAASFAQADDASGEAGDEEARRIYQLGEDAFDNERFAEAAAYFEQALALSGRPELLFNVGASYQRDGNAAEAIRAFEQYLALAPGSEHDDEIEVRLRVLRMSEDSGTETEPPTDERQPSQSSGVPAGPLVLVIAGAGAMVGGAVALFIGGSKRANVEEPDAGSFWVDVESDADAARTLGIVGGVALGVGAALAVLGIVLWTQSGDSDENDLTVRATFGGAMLEGQW